MSRFIVFGVCLLGACGDDSGGARLLDGPPDARIDVAPEAEVEATLDTQVEAQPETTPAADTVVELEVSDEVDAAPIAPCQGLCATDEVCDFNGECYCRPGSERLCTTKVSECAAGRRACVDGEWTNCEAIPVDAPEVCDGRDNDCDGVTDEEGCSPPDVVCPPAQEVDFAATVLLEGAGSDPDGGEVRFEWAVSDAPGGSGLVMPSPLDRASSSIVPDAQGLWVLELCAIDDEGAQTCCETQVTVRPACEPPATPELTSCDASWDRRPILQFPPLPAGQSYTIDAAGVPLGQVELVGQNYYRPSAPLASGGPPPAGASIELGLRACRQADETCCSERATAVVGLIESCTEPIAPTPDNLIISEYLINGDGVAGCPGDTCEAGEAIELTNLSNCPVALANHHLRYCNNVECSSARRYDNFGAADIIPPRGVFVRIRKPELSTCGFDFLPPVDSDRVFGIKRSTLELKIDGNFNNASGWFNNGTAGSLRVATGAYVGPFSGTTILLVNDYVRNQDNCESVGFDALGACGEIAGGVVPTDKLHDNQLGRLWHPCDAVVDAYPTTCFDTPASAAP